MPETPPSAFRMRFRMTPQQSRQAGPITNPIYTQTRLVDSREAKQLVRGGFARFESRSDGEASALISLHTGAHTAPHPSQGTRASGSVPTC